MKTSIAVLAAAILVFAVLPVTAVDIGTGIGIDIQTEKFKPLVWMCDHRTVFEDNVEEGRISEGGDPLVERIENYAFEGEQIQWKVLVMDKNGIDKVKDVFMTIGPSQGPGNDIEANCKRIGWEPTDIPSSCNARILEEQLTEFNDETMSFYWCTFTVETPDSMQGEYWVTVEVEDLDGLSSIMDENEYWFLNPTIALAIDGGLTFSDVRPGTQSYSETLKVGNDAEEGSGVMLDMFITGTDFYDSSSSGAKCPSTNQLALTNFRYFASNGGYSTLTDGRNDPEGYVPICYGDKFQPGEFYDTCEIIQGDSIAVNGANYYLGNFLSPGAEIAMTFRLDLPEPCNGDFDTGQIFFWGEAI
jgi:hypothetical protein